MKQLIFILAIFTSIQTFSQSVDWEKDFGWDYTDELVDITKYKDHYYSIGRRARLEVLPSIGFLLPSICKTDSLGDTLWHITFDSLLINSQQTVLTFSDFIKIKTGKDNNLLVAGNYRSSFNNPDRDIFLISFDTNGTIECVTFMNYPVIKQAKLVADLEVLPNGDAVVAGITGPNNYLVAKCDKYGNILWAQNHYDTAFTGVFDMTVYSDGSFFLSGSSSDSLLITKIDPVDGNVLWHKARKIPGDTNARQWANYVNEDMNHNLVIACMTSAWDYSNLKGYFCIIDTDFNFINYKLIAVNKSVYYVYQLEDSNYVIAHPNFTIDDCRIQKVNNLGDSLWTVDISGLARFISDGANGLMCVGYKEYPNPTKKNSYLAHIKDVGYPAQIPCLAPPVIDTMYATLGPGQFQFEDSVRGGLKYNSELYHQWYFQDGQTADSADPLIFFNNVAYPDSFWAVLIVFDGAGCSDTMAINAYTNEIIDNPWDVSGVKERDPGTGPGSVRVYPNPFEQSFTLQVQGTKSEVLSIRVSNSLGQVQETPHQVRGGSVVIDAANWERGLYLLQMKTLHGLQTIKLVKQ